MDSIKIVTKTLFGIFRLLAIVYLFVIVYSILCLFTGWGITLYDNSKLLHINYPFSTTPFLNLDNNANYQIFSFIFPTLLYGVFFWLTANVFKIFYQDKLFTQKNVIQLKRFYYFNITIPLISTVLASLFVEPESMIWILVVVHFILGVFTYLLATIFKKGLKLQNEQDLFI